jgi:hypothetical protein
MSTAALASARRRRTTNDAVVTSQNVSTKTPQQDSPNIVKQVMPPPQSLTPLQILQLHDNKLKDLESLLVELNSEEYITNVVDGKINDLIQAKLSAFSSELDKVRTSVPNANMETSMLDTKLQLLETSIQSSLTIQNVKIDEFKNGIQENFNTFKDNTIKMIDLLGTKENHISSKDVVIPNISVEKLDMVISDMNELKLLVIKNQTLALETSNSIINMKDEFKLNNEKIARAIEKLETAKNMCCSEAQCDPAQMFLQSFMNNKLFGGGSKMNMESNYDDDQEFDHEEDTKKLHIDLTDEQLVIDDEELISSDEKIKFDANELIIDENQLQEILDLSAMPEINLEDNNQTSNEPSNETSIETSNETSNEPSNETSNETSNVL